MALVVISLLIFVYIAIALFIYVHNDFFCASVLLAACSSLTASQRGFGQSSASP